MLVTGLTFSVLKALKALRKTGLVGGSFSCPCPTRKDDFSMLKVLAEASFNEASLPVSWDLDSGTLG